MGGRIFESKQLDREDFLDSLFLVRLFSAYYDV